MVDWYDATRSRQFLPWCASGGIQKPGDLAPQAWDGSPPVRSSAGDRGNR